MNNYELRIFNCAERSHFFLQKPEVGVLTAKEMTFATGLTLVVTPSMLMVFTRDRRRAGQRTWLQRLLRRKPTDAEAMAMDQDAAVAAKSDEPAIVYPKAAE